MANSKTVDMVIAEADRLAKVWEDNSSFAMGDVTLAGLKAEIDKLRDMKRARDEARIALTRLVDDTNDQTRLIDGFVTRGRSGMKAFFGPDSAQYEQVGGTRKSEQKSRAARKAKTP